MSASCFTVAVGCLTYNNWLLEGKRVVVDLQLRPPIPPARHENYFEFLRPSSYG